MSKKTYTRIFLILFSVILSCGLVGCKNSSVKEENVVSVTSESSKVEKPNENVFYGEVIDIESDFGGILVKPESDILPPELVVHSENMPKLSVGDRVRIEHSGQIAMSYPGQIFGAKIEIVK